MHLPSQTRSRSNVAVACLAAFAGALLLAIASPAAAQTERRRDDGPPDRRVVPPGQRPGDRPGDGRWWLGVTTQAASIGERVLEVERRSPAERAGLERGDLIVAVNGYQIGRVGNRTYPLDRELDLRADASGRVDLLVQNRRNNQLVTLDVRLETHHGGGGPGRPLDWRIGGTVTWRERMLLPPGSEMRVRVVREKFLGSETVAERTFRAFSASPGFELSVEVDRADRDRIHEVIVEIYDGRKRIMVSDGRYRIRPSDGPVRLDISMRRV